MSEAEDGTPRRVGITIGPQYGTVGPAFIKDAAREAIADGDLDLLCVLGVRVRPRRCSACGDELRRPPTRGSPRSPPSAGSAGSRCCSCA